MKQNREGFDRRVEFQDIIWSVSNKVVYLQYKIEVMMVSVGRHVVSKEGTYRRVGTYLYSILFFIYIE